MSPGAAPVSSPLSSVSIAYRPGSVMDDSVTDSYLSQEPSDEDPSYDDGSSGTFPAIVQKLLCAKAASYSFETFSPVVWCDSIRFVLAFFAAFCFQMHRMDVASAFLNGILDVEIYMVQTPGFVRPGAEKKVCRLHKSLYGLKQVPLCWNQQINRVLKDGGFTRPLSEYGVYCFTFPSGSPILIALYDDDLLIMGADIDLISSVRQLLPSHFQMIDLGLAKGRVSLFLNSYIETLKKGKKKKV
ncbi:binding protein [[Candida] boidinii]|nr:binding protein [[Candida] boidinii]